MHTADLSVYLVLDPDMCGGARGMVLTALAAAQNGATIVQLRAPNWKKRALVECGRELKKVLAPLGVPLIINDHADVCVACDADGLHVGQKDLLPEDARTVIGSDRILGLSVNTLEEAQRIPKALVDYIGIGPYRATATKKDAGHALGAQGVAEIAREAALPSVAIGGIKLAHVADVLSSGVDGIAVVSAICGTGDAEAAAQALRIAVDADLKAQHS